MKIYLKALLATAVAFSTLSSIPVTAHADDFYLGVGVGGDSGYDSSDDFEYPRYNHYDDEDTYGDGDGYQNRDEYRYRYHRRHTHRDHVYGDYRRPRAVKQVCLVTFFNRNQVQGGADANVARAQLLPLRIARRLDGPNDRRRIFDYGSPRQNRATCRYLNNINN